MSFGSMLSMALLVTKYQHFYMRREVKINRLLFPSNFQDETPTQQFRKAGTDYKTKQREASDFSFPQKQPDKCALSLV